MHLVKQKFKLVQNCIQWKEKYSTSKLSPILLPEATSFNDFYFYFFLCD